ncbi:MAG: hypothetical protein NXI16_10345 [Alphaproteobacteria bacterium]|nr:hypothetical protein [Alphaproteobacteria bacterium]
MTTSSQASKGQHHTPTDEAHNQAPDVVAPRSAPRSTDGAIEPATMICVIDPALDGITSVVAALVASLKSKGVALSIEFQGDLAAEQCHGLTVMARQCAANSAEAGPKHGETVPRSTSLPRIRLVCLRPRNLVDHIKRRLVELVSTTSVVWFVPHNTDMTSFDQFTARLLEAIEPSIKRLSLINVVSARDTLQARRSSHLEILRAPATGAGWKTGIFRPLPLAIQQAFEQAPFPLMELPRFGPADVAKRLGRRPANANRDFHAFASFLSEAKHAFDEADLLPKRQKGKVQ